MIGDLVSLLMGLAVAAAYGLVQVRSPAPPMIALVGLFGMVLGQQTSRWRSAISRHRLRPPSKQEMGAPGVILTRQTLGWTAIPSYLPNRALLKVLQNELFAHSCSQLRGTQPVSNIGPTQIIAIFVASRQPQHTLGNEFAY
jgi:XapX domain-containing protein